MNIRKARDGDVPALQSILRRSWLATWAPELAFAIVQRFAAADPAGSYARDKWQEFFVAEEHGQVLGMFHIAANHLHAIHLDPKHKRRKIGSLLMDEVERRIGMSHQDATLEVRAFNKGAIAFYLNRGWVQSRTYQDTECGEPVETLELVKQLEQRLRFAL
jgi:ribosomal protein S18 acetylase RimI-like enzyme